LTLFFFQKGHPNQKGGCPNTMDTLDTPILDPPLDYNNKIRSDNDDDDADGDDDDATEEKTIGETIKKC